MIDIIAPEIAPRADSLLAENAVEISERADAVLFPGSLADADDDLLLIVLVDIGMIRGHVGQEALRRVVVERLVHPALEEDIAVIDAGQRQAS